jgi:hypothetical protein
MIPAGIQPRQLRIAQHRGEKSRRPGIVVRAVPVRASGAGSQKMPGTPIQ